MTAKVLITGASGFAGSHLVEYLSVHKKYKLFGTYLLGASLKNIDTTRYPIDLLQVDLTDDKKVTEIIKAIQPDLIFHLAALPSPAESFRKPLETIVNNVSIQINILEAIKEANLLKTRILIVSSADVYGMVSRKSIPIDEDTPFTPTNSYAVSKITQDFLGLQYSISYGLPIVRVRPFNHIGPRQSPQFVISSFAKQIAEIEKGTKENILHVGNIKAKRDFTDVRDVVRAYSLIIEKGKSAEVYNIGSGVSYKISDILDILLSFSKVKIAIQIDPSLLRPGDTPDFICNNQKIKKTINWEPAIPIEQTLKDTLDYWRNIV